MILIQPSSNSGVLRNRQLKRFYLMVSIGQMKILAYACSEVVPSTLHASVNPCAFLPTHGDSLSTQSE